MRRSLHFPARLNTMGSFVCCVLLASFTACMNDQTTQRQFEIEKVFFRAQKATDRIMINPRIAASTDYSEATSLYRRVVREAGELPDNPWLNGLCKRSLGSMAQLEIMQEHVEAAVEVYQEILKRYPADDEISLAARLGLASLYERSFSYRDAVENYAVLLPTLVAKIDPENPQSYLLAIPSQYARLHRLEADRNRAVGAYEHAAATYEQIIHRWPNSKAAIQATNLLLTILADLQKWDRLSTVLDEQIKKHQRSEDLPQFLFLKAQLMHNRLNNPEVALSLLQGLLASYPDHEIAPSARLEIALIYMERGHYDKARELLAAITQKYRDRPALAAHAHEQIARSFELQGNWEQALNDYRWLAKQYEGQPAALTAPLQIARYYTEHNNPVLAEKAYTEAVEYYQGLINKYPKSMLAALAQEQIANCFIVQKKWQEAVTATSKIAQVLDNNVGHISTYLLLGRIYETTNQRELATKVYREFIKQFPQHPLVGMLEERVRRLTSS
ncbi:MAG: tetratricopeptide repeat protein [bacterium]